LIDLYNAEGSYFVGNIVVEKKEENSKNFLDVIDGQQRLTTLFLLSTIAEEDNKFSKLKLSYEIRKEDGEYLEELRSNKQEESHNTTNVSTQFKTNISTIKKFLNDKELEDEKKLNDEKITLKKLLGKVKLVVTFLPQDTNITKYFEVMNNRGKQLEKHQILKAKFLDGLEKQDDLKIYAKIWEACSNMDIYLEDSPLIRKGTITDFRAKLINYLIDEKLNISELEESSEATEQKSILELLNPKNTKDVASEIGSKEYRSIIKFPIFLLHCLKLYIVKNNPKKITIDDNKLIEQFEKCFFKEKDITAKKIDFIRFMLKQRILFDYFIFKREIDGDNKPFFEELTNDIKNPFKKNDDLLMIQLLFNINDSQSQNWLSLALKMGHIQIYSKNIQDFSS